MVNQEMEMGMETIANGNVKENHGFTHSFPWNFSIGHNHQWKRVPILL